MSKAKLLLQRPLGASMNWETELLSRVSASGMALGLMGEVRVSARKRR
jgi:hypothetical protein